MSTFTTLVNFNGTNGASLESGLIIGDAAGDLFGTTEGGGPDGYGFVFEIVNNGTVASPSYASTPTVLASFNETNAPYGANPEGGLIATTGGDLLGTTANGGLDGYGTVFEIAKTGGTPTILWNFTGGTDGALPESSLIIGDAAGDLFGTASEGGANGDGAVFEIANTGTLASPSYASTPTVLAGFNGTNGAEPYASLIADPYGDLFGTTYAGGADGYGTVFEIAKTSSGYEGTPTTLVSFTDADGAGPYGGSLIADSAGDLFGTTQQGGAYTAGSANNLGYGTVFEIPYVNGSYANTPTTLVSFDDTDGAYPDAGLIADAAGDLFGTTVGGGAGSYGTVFEIVNNGTVASPSYASTPTTLESFNGANGYGPESNLIADAAVNLLGTTTGISAVTGNYVGDGTAFELSGAGFVVPVAAFAVDDVTTGAPSTSPGTPYRGPVYGLIDQYINTSADNLNVAAGVPNTFIRLGSGQGGSGEDAIDVSRVGGINVLDGENGSNFLVGGTGPFSFDTFFVEDSTFSGSQSNSIWSTVANFHAGDAATIFGITPNGFNLAWVDGQGAAGYTGLTLHVTAPGAPEASLTLSGYTTANLPTGTAPTLTMSYGTESNGTPYLYIQAHS